MQKTIKIASMIVTTFVVSFITWYFTNRLVNTRNLTSQAPLQIIPAIFKVTQSDPSVHSLTKKFLVKNTSKSEIIVESVLPTCSCTILKEYTHIKLSPQSYFEVEFSVDIPQYGSKRSFIMVKHNVSQTPSEVVIEAIGMTSLPSVISKKSFDVVFFNLNDLSESRQIVLVTKEELGSKPWLDRFISQIEEADLSSKISEKLRDDSIERRYEITIRWKQLPKSNEFLGKVFAITSDKNAPLPIGSISGTLPD